jgi:hypothetical protein
VKHLKHPATIIAAVALFIALGGGAAAYASGLISGSQITNHSIAEKKLTKKAIKALRGQRGRRGATGATGAAGPAGPAGPAGAAGAAGAPGAPGSPGFVSVGGFSGGISSIPPATGVFEFAGPVTTLTTTASQSIVASGSSALGTTSATVEAGIAICVSPTGANTPTQLDPSGGVNTNVFVTSTRLSYAASQTGSPGAGTWDVGMCVTNFDATNAINNNDWSVGYAFVANGTPVSGTPKLASPHR